MLLISTAAPAQVYHLISTSYATKSRTGVWSAYKKMDTTRITIDLNVGKIFIEDNNGLHRFYIDDVIDHGYDEDGDPFVKFYAMPIGADFYVKMMYSRTYRKGYLSQFYIYFEDMTLLYSIQKE
jgi:hypothetical protein